MRFADEFGYYELNPFPGNACVCVSNNAVIYPEFRGQGKGQEQHKQRLEQARNLGYTYILATVHAGNAVELHILQKNGWADLGGFYNHGKADCTLLYGKLL